MTDPISPPAWKAIPEHPKEFWDGQKYLVCLRVRNADTNKEAWEYYKIQVGCDVESPVSFYYGDFDLIGHMEPFTDWDWDDFEYYIEIEDL